MNKTITFGQVPSNAIVGCATTALTVEEKAWFQSMRPVGLILFARNINTPQQVADLVDEFKLITNNQYALILIDQEGGRVSRLPSPHWRIPPSPTEFAKLYQVSPDAAVRACKLNYQLIGADLKRVGVNVNCAPMLDIPQANASRVVTDRALGNTPGSVIALAQATVAGLQLSGVEPVIKHGPGHGRGTTDSHKTLPIVDADLNTLAAWDFLPFEHFKNQSMLMTAHILYTAIDNTYPGTLSPKVVNEVIRNQIGFDGLIMTDDIDMHALSGTTAEKATQALHAGCDLVLQCSGNIEDLWALEPALTPLSGKALTRTEIAASKASASFQDIDDSALLSELDSLLSGEEGRL
ncbi:beta-N-acetylhexosaminidase [Paraglaciecola sp. 2405UD69-4]|uniref:beta-N-acetylhexosaminidase n=1 Tax=Paraglaciecola sp. 2405UD69-4 TaxID=3391836 RepID=UPI0039C9AF9D